MHRHFNLDPMGGCNDSQNRIFSSDVRQFLELSLSKLSRVCETGNPAMTNLICNDVYVHEAEEVKTPGGSNRLP